MDRYDSPMPPSWASVFGFVIFVALFAAVSAPAWLPALDQQMQWLDGVQRGVAELGK